MARRHPAFKKRRKRPSLRLPPVRPVGSASATPPPDAASDREAARQEPRRQAPVRGQPSRRFSDYAADYRYVAEDLRRILLIGGSLCLAMVVLSFALS